MGQAMKKTQFRQPLGRVLAALMCTWCLVNAAPLAANAGETAPAPSLGVQIVDNKLGTPVTVPAGASVVLEMDGVDRVQVADPKVADVVAVGRKEIVVNGTSPGTTTLHVWHVNGRSSFEVIVTDPPSEPLENRIAKAIGLPNVTVSQYRDTVMLEGYVSNDAARIRAESIALAYSAQVVNLLQVEGAAARYVPAAGTQWPADANAAMREVEAAVADTNVHVYILGDTLVLEGIVTSGFAKDRAEKLAAVRFPKIVSLLQVKEPGDTMQASRIQEMIGIASVTVRLGNSGQVVLEGKVENQGDYDRAQKVASVYSQQVTNLLKVSHPKQVVLSVQVVESERTDALSYGIEWGSLASGSPVPFTFAITQATGGGWLAPPLSAKTHAKSTIGTTKLLAAPTLLTLSGQEASFHAGGSIPIALPSTNGVQIEWHDYGVLLKMLPVVEDSGEITVRVTPEVSTLDWANGVRISGFLLPALKMRRAETNLRLQPEQTVVLGGLLQPSESTQVEKVPLLGDLPVIGQLFRSQGFQKGESELLIFVTPRILEPGQAATVADVVSPAGIQPAQYASDNAHQNMTPAGPTQLLPKNDVTPALNSK